MACDISESSENADAHVHVHGFLLWYLTCNVLPAHSHSWRKMQLAASYFNGSTVVAVLLL